MKHPWFITSFDALAIERQTETQLFQYQMMAKPILQRDEHGYLWSNHRDGSISAPVLSGELPTKARISPSLGGGSFTPTIHGTCLTNEKATLGEGDYGFLTKYEWPTLEEAKAAIRERTTPR